MKITVVLGIIAIVAAVGAVDLVTTLVLSGQAFANGASHACYTHIIQTPGYPYVPFEEHASSTDLIQRFSYLTLQYYMI
jgi:hypothetical protein